MDRKSEHIVRYTAEELMAMQARGETKSDWEKAMSVPLPDGSDPDDAMEDLTPEQLALATTELPMPRNKKHASLRLDADMLDWFRAQGRGYQTRMNAVLRLYYQQQTQKRG